MRKQRRLMNEYTIKLLVGAQSQRAHARDSRRRHGKMLLHGVAASAAAARCCGVRACSSGAAAAASSSSSTGAFVLTEFGRLVRGEHASKDSGAEDRKRAAAIRALLDSALRVHGSQSLPSQAQDVLMRAYGCMNGDAHSQLNFFSLLANEFGVSRE